MHRLEIFGIALAALSAHLVPVLPLPPIVQASLVLIYCTLIPGWLLVKALLGAGAAADRWVRLIYSLAAGYGVTTLLVLLASYLPGGLGPWLTLALFNGAILGLIGWCWFARAPVRVSSPLPVQPWVWVGAVALLLVGGVLRFGNLGYAEFQGDEGRAILRGAAVIQGYEEVLFLHKKGPLEILLPTTTFAIAGRLTEAMARLPFALAGLGGVFALWLLGARWVGSLAGWCAAVLLALDGYFIGFARIVQYQSVVLLVTLALLLLLSHVQQQPTGVPAANGGLARALLLAAFLLTTGILAHYEASLAILPALFLLWPVWRQTPPLTFWRAVGYALVMGAGLLSLFFIPFLLHPNFRYTFLYLAEDRVGLRLLYNHLADFLGRTTLYNTTYAVLLLIGLTIGALIRTVRSAYGVVWAWLLSVLILGGLSVTLLRPAWLVVGEQDWTGLLLLLILIPAWVAPRQPLSERLLWVWFGGLFVLALFLVSKPRTHVYVFFMPWFLIAGGMAAHGWRWLARCSNRSLATITGVTVACALGALFANYAYLYFVYHKVEILRQWADHRPPGYWTFYDQPESSSLFGFPQRSGWKAAGVLYQEGVLVAPFATYAGSEWVTDWYLRGAEFCLRQHEYYLLGNHLSAETRAKQTEFERQLQKEYQPWGVVQVNSEARLQIYTRRVINQPAQIFDLASYEEQFDRELSTPFLPLTAPVVEPQFSQPLHLRLGETIWLEGYDVDSAQVQPGESLRLTLYWRTTAPVEARYHVFNQIIGAKARLLGQQDGQPGCEAKPTDDWTPGEVVVDRYRIPVVDSAPPGEYSLLTGLYLPESGERLLVYGADGQARGDAIELQKITVVAAP